MRTDSPRAHRVDVHTPQAEPVGEPDHDAPGPVGDMGEEPGQERFLRPFAVAAGDPDGHMLDRTEADPDTSGLDLLSLVMAARAPDRHEWLRPERETILNHSLRARTVVELAAAVGLPVGQVRGMVSGMIAEGSLQRCGPSRPLGHEDILHAVLVGLRSL